MRGDWIKDHNNEFWRSARDHHLDEFLARVYQSQKKLEIVRKWLKDGELRRVVLRQLDFPADPLAIELRADGYAIRICDDEPEPEADATLEMTHEAAISACTSLKSFLVSWFYRQIHVPRLWGRRRDNYYAARIFLRP